MVKIILLWLITLVACSALEEWLSPKLEVRVRPMILLKRGDVRVEVHVSPDERNRLLVLSWSGEPNGQAGSTMRQLEGEDAAVIHEFWLKDVVPANYEIVAATFDRDGKKIATAFGRVTTPEER